MLGLRCYEQIFSSRSKHGQLLVAGLLTVVASLVAEHGLQGSVVQHTGLVALQHVESSQTRDRTRVHSLGRQILSTVPPGKPCF